MNLRAEEEEKWEGMEEPVWRLPEKKREEGAERIALEGLDGEEIRKLRREAARAVLEEEGEVETWARGLRIRTARGLAEIQPYAYQRRMWEAGRKYSTRVILKARQVGVTQGVALEMLARGRREPNTYSLFISARQDTANEALNMVKAAFLSDDPAERLIEDTKSTAGLPNGAKVICLPANESAARGYTATHVYLDEFADMPFAHEIYEAATPTLSRGGDLTIVSTPKGRSGRFWEIWRDAGAGKNGFWRQRIHWTQCPAYNPVSWGLRFDHQRRIEAEKGAWFVENRRKYSDTEWQRQYECDFVASVDLFFDQEALERLRRRAKRPVAADGGVKTYAEAQKGRQYVIGADPGTGIAQGDFSVAVVLDAATGEEVAMLRGRWPTAEFANRIWDLRQRGYQGMIVPERTGIGIALCEKLMEIDPRLLYRDKEDHRVGWRTTGKTRPSMLRSLQEAVRAGDVGINSMEFYREAEVFQAEGGAPQGEHDDCVMAMAMAWEVRKQMPSLEERPMPRSWAGRRPEAGRTGY